MKLSGCCLIALGLLVSSGCGKSGGPETAAVSGTVSLDGQPIAEGDITFAAADGLSPPFAGKIIEGKYSFACTLGKKRVEITAYRDIPGKYSEDNPGEKTLAREQYIPDSANKQSTLQADVSRDGSNSFDFNLLSAPK